MASGIHSTIKSLHNRLMMRWCEKWYEGFSDPVIGGFYERLGKGFQPVLTGQRRLVTQCRQLSIYSHAVHAGNKNFKPDLRANFEFIVNRYYNENTGLWIFSLDDDGAVSKTDCDLYALTFVIFSFSHYFMASGDERAQKLARQALDLINTKFRMDEGFAEGLHADGKIIESVRRQDPHMHLLEACLFAHETWNDAAYEGIADELVTLFQRRFFDDSDCTLPEDYTDDLDPHPDKGHIFEPGHYCEWVWLLKKYAVLKGEPSMYDGLCLTLLSWTNQYGWDNEYGGIYDGVGAGGVVLEDTKRIWPFCEALKANALMLEIAPDRQAVKDRVADMVRIFESKYMQERGFWIETLTRDLQPAADYMPGTTPYHVYFGITETMLVLQSRGDMISLGGKLDTGIYVVRQMLSKTARKIRKLIAA